MRAKHVCANVELDKPSRPVHFLTSKIGQSSRQTILSLLKCFSTIYLWHRSEPKKKIKLIETYSKSRLQILLTKQPNSSTVIREIGKDFNDYN